MIPRRSRPHFHRHKERARAMVHERVAHFNAHYNFTLRKIFIKNHKSRWGSCSSAGNLNFSYRIVFLPQEIADYIIVHELCHLAEFNHGPNFWAEVARTVPEHKKIRRKLRTLERESHARPERSPWRALKLLLSYTGHHISSSK